LLNVLFVLNSHEPVLQVLCIKVEQQPDGQIAELQVCFYLVEMDSLQLLDAFQFDDQLFLDEQVNDICCVQQAAAIDDRPRDLGIDFKPLLALACPSGIPD